jgi:hypothetical protein
LTIDSKKKSILQFILKNPGVTSVDIKVGLSRSAVGAHARTLMDAGMIIKDAANGWHIANDFVVEIDPKSITPIDIVAEHVRKMIDLK